MSTTMAPTTTELTGERFDLFQALTNARHFLRFTVRDLSDDQGRIRTTDSELTLGGLIKHVSEVEQQWQNFIIQGRSAMSWDGVDFFNMPPEALEAFANAFRMGPEETLEGLLDQYEHIAATTDSMLAQIDLDEHHDLPEAPWFVDKSWSNRRTLLHIIAETTQHAGHADIIRESLDGAKSMG